jgi:mono/diheme cytochrome c family protein
MTILILASLALLPLALVARARGSKSTSPPVHLVQDMDNQPKFKAQAANPLFADGRAMRPPVAGTVARGEVEADERFYRGRVDGQWVTTFPMAVTLETMQRGQQRFSIYCSVCHGLDGEGNGIVNLRAQKLEEGTWVPPTSLSSQVVRDRAVGHLFNTITYGIRTMPAYGEQIPAADRWAIVAYLRALQRSQNAPVDDVPEDIRPSLR